MGAEQKLDRFKQSILKELENQEADMNSRMEEERKAAFEKAEDEVLAQCYTYIKGETARLQTEAHRSVSERTLEMKKDVLRKRTALCDGLFEELRQKVAAYVQTDAYVKYLESCLDDVLKSIPGETQIEISLNSEDAKKLSLENMTVLEKNFPLGGFELVAKDSGKFFDARLDTKISQLRQDFINTFNITV